MNRDPFGLGHLLYGFAPPSPVVGEMLALAASGHWQLIPAGHEGCSISTFCRNPLHPGPCAGWKKKLGMEAPGALHAIEKAHKEKVAAKRVATAEAKSAAAKTLTSRHHASPLHAKKALIKRANMLLGNDEGKASGKADKVILNKQEIKKYSKIKAAHVNSIRTKHGLQEDPGLEDRIAEALALDNKGGKDDNYRAAIHGSSESLAAQLAVEHCHKGNHKECDDQVLAQLRTALLHGTDAALLTGDDSQLDQTLADWDAGKLDLGPAGATAADLKAAEKAAWSPHGQTAESTLAAFDKLGHDDFKSLDAPTRAKAVEILKQMANNPNMPEKERTKAADIAAKWTAPGMATFPLGTKNQLDLSKAVYTGTLGDIAKAHGALSDAEKKGLPKAHQPAIDKALQHVKAKNKAKAAQLLDAKAKGGAMMDAAKAKTDKIAEDKAKAAELLGAKAKAADLMDQAKAKTDKIAADKAKAAEAAKAAPSAPAEPAAKKPVGLAGWHKAQASGTPEDQKAVLVKVSKNNFDKWPEQDKKDAKAFLTGMHSQEAKDAAKKLGLGEHHEAAQKGMEFGLGLMAHAKGNKTLGTKAAQEDFAGKIEAHLDGDPTKKDTIAQGAAIIADTLVHNATSATLTKPNVSLTTSEKNAVKLAAIQEITKGLKGEDGPFPVVDALKNGISAVHDGDYPAATKATAQVKQALADSVAAEHGLPAGTPAAVVAAHVVFKPGTTDWNDGKTGQRVGVLNAMTPAEFDQLGPATQAAVADWLESRAKALDTSADDPDFASVTAYAKMIELQQKFGLPEHKPEHDWGASVPQPVQDLKDAIATDSPAWQIKQAAAKVSIADVKKHLTDDEKAKLKAAQDAPAPKPFDPNATPATKPGDVVTEDGHLVDLHQMFGDEGDPDHAEVVQAVTAMTKDDYDALSPKEQGNLWAHLQDADSAGEPGSAMNKIKISTWEKENAAAAKPTPPTPGITPVPPPPASLGPEAKAAAGYATGATSGTAKVKLAAYEKVSGDEFKQLPPATQQAILADLKAIEQKFLDPKKKAQAKDHHDYLAQHIGIDAAAPAASVGKPSDQDKIDAGAAVLADMIGVVGDAPDPAKAAASGKNILAKAMENGQYDKLAEQMGLFQSQIGMEKLAKMHALDPDVVKEVQAQLAEDVAKKLKAEPGPTPTYDAWFKAVQTGSPADLDALGKAAAGKPLAVKKAPSAHDVALIKASTAMALFDAWHGTPDPGAVSSKQLDEELANALSDGIGSPKHQAWAKATAEDMAAITLDQTFNHLGWPQGVEDSISHEVKAAAAKSIAADFEKALLTTDPYDNGKPAEYLKQAIGDINKATNKLVDEQGWDPGSPQVQEYQKAILQAKLENIPQMWPAPAAAPVTPAAPVPSSPAGKAKAAAKPAVTKLGSGSDIAHIPFDTQKSILGDLKGLPSGKYLSDPKEQVYGNLLTLAHAYGTADEPMSVLQVLKSIDNAFSQQLGVPNANKWENEFTDWLTTPDGSAFAIANTSPDANLLKKFQGIYDGPTTDLAELAKKVQLYPGPGKFDPDKPSSDFGVVKLSGTGHPKRSIEAEQLSKEMFAASGKPWTAAQKQGVYTYTGGSYSAMNGWLRGEQSTISDSLKTAIKNTQAAMRPVTKDILVHRGTGWEQLPEGFRSPEGAKKLIGQTILDEAFLSTSVGGTPAFGGPLMLEVEVPKGAYAVYASGKHEDGSNVSQHPNEMEMLLAAGGHYQVIGVTQVGHQTVVRMRVVNAI